MIEYAPNPMSQFFDDDGMPLVNGILKTFEAGTDTPLATFNAEGTENEVEIKLNARGECCVRLDPSKRYKFMLCYPNGDEVWTLDYIGAGSGSGGAGGIEVRGSEPNGTKVTEYTDSSGKKIYSVALTNSVIAKITSSYVKPNTGIPKSDMAQDVKDSLSNADTAVQPDGLVKLVRVDAAQTFNDAEKAQGRSNIGAGTYSKPSGGIPSADMALAVQNSLSKADSAYQKPSGGIPSSDMITQVQTALSKAETAYQKPSSGIPSTDLASAVQTSLAKADSAYQKPLSGIPSSDMTTQVQNALSLALSSMQGYDVDTYNNNPKSRHVLLFTANVASSAYASCIVNFVNTYGNGNTGSSVSVLVTLVARTTNDINVYARVISNNNWDFGSNFPAVMYYVDNVNNTIEVRIALLEYDADVDSFIATQMNYLNTSVIPLPKTLNVTWNLTAHTNGGRTGQINVVAGLTGVYGTLPRVDVNLTSGTNNIYLDRNALYRFKCASGSSIINLLSHNTTPVHCPIQILKNNQCEVLTLNWFNDAGYSESAQVSFDTGVQTGYQGDIAYFDVNIWKDGANVIRRWMN